MAAAAVRSSTVNGFSMANRRRPDLVQFGKLRRLHFNLAPVWVACHSFDYDEPWFEETTEETFRPWNGTLPFDPGLGMAVILADFKLADGTLMSGFLTPQVRANVKTTFDLGILQPYIFGPGGRQLNFWCGSLKPSPRQKQRVYSRLGRTARKVFPITFSSKPDLALGISAGTIKGFCSIPDFKEPVFET